jgi:hypothetical protein
MQYKLQLKLKELQKIKKAWVRYIGSLMMHGLLYLGPQ